MAKTKYKYLETATAAVDLLTRYRFVSLNAAGLAIVPAAGAKVSGQIEEPAKAGRPVTYACGGRLKVEAAAAIVAGVQVQTDATGKAIILAAGVPVGVTRTAVLNAGDLVEIEVS